MEELVIDCTEKPETILFQVNYQETRLGKVTWSLDAFALWQSPKQHTNQKSDGYIIRKELADKILPPANILRVLQKNPHCIPKEWENKAGSYPWRIFALGTTFHLNGVVLVEYLTKKDGEWTLGHWPLSFEMNSKDFSLISR
ncbi:MAG: hypothetical protein RIQ54_27 [Candidatus Parcubacteria bacterium]|jgi:hypothetical protein